jgi:tetratricopeptide (TPR) repeat protein
VVVALVVAGIVVAGAAYVVPQLVLASRANSRALADDLRGFLADGYRLARWPGRSQAADWVRIGIAHVELGETAEAEAALDRALALGDRGPELARMRALVYFSRTGDADGAIRALGGIAEEVWRSHTYAAMFLLEVGRADEADQAAQHALAQVPGAALQVGEDIDRLMCSITAVRCAAATGDVPRAADLLASVDGAGGATLPAVLPPRVALLRELARAEVAAAAGRPADALATLRAAESVLATVGDTDVAAEVHRALGAWAGQVGEVDLSRHHTVMARDAFARFGPPQSVAALDRRLER